MSLASDIEQELDVPILAADITLYWQIYRTLGLAPVGDHGSLLNSLTTSESEAR